ncbi:NAD(P)-binding protein [Elizabethkingia argentiflava]|uniref:NAD(P)-binding protein n=1 Tax=Elizabethkingia argenteiflava TaxID=2681556 RepID=A0A845PPC7_9FLAO|nr:NAD(P)-binding protein [Elizabethkingia argenteiflava]NAW50189.1 NAD(P)-binding protein [Elizabethkingia argenteiflava]
MVAVIGAGISGVSFSHYCALKDYKVKIFEKENRIGGCIEGHALMPEYIAELGAHTLTNKYRKVLEIIKDCHQQNKMIPLSDLKFELAEHNNLVAFIKRINLSELIFSIPQFLVTSKKNKSVREYYSAVLGNKNYESLFHFIFQAILCQNPDNFPAELLFRKRSRDPSFPKKFTLTGGITQFLESVVSQHQNIELHFNTEVTKITKKNGLYQLWCNEQKLLSASYLNFSCPPHITKALLQEIEPHVSDMINSLKLTNIESLLIDMGDLPALKKIKKSLIGIDQAFYSAIYHEVQGKKFWVFHFKGKVYNLEQKKNIIAHVLKTDPTKLQVLREKHSILPALQLHDLQKINLIQEEMRNKKIFLSTNWIAGLSMEDCCQRSFYEFKRMEALSTLE